MAHTVLTNKRASALFCKLVLGVSPEELRKVAEDLPKSTVKSFENLISESFNVQRRINLSWLKFLKQLAEGNKKRWQ